MDEPALRQLLEDVRTGVCHPDDAVARLRRLPFADLGFARVDHHRALRQRVGEAVYAPGKSPEQCALIVAELLSEPGSTPVLLTRAGPEQVSAALETSPGGTVTSVGPLALVAWRPAPVRPGRIVLVTAGTADLPVAGECMAALFAMGLRPQLVADCGVAGVHRLLASIDELTDADVVVVVAGMEGALASLVAGITPAPVVAVPSSPGYGASLEGVTALLAMHASCAAGLTVVGIDNGFGAACAVARHPAMSPPSSPDWGESPTGPDPGAASEQLPTVAWFHCFAGIAGDMALGSLIDAGADVDEVLGLLERLPFHGWRLRCESVLRAGVGATRAIVEVTDDVVVRTHAHIVGLVQEARLPDRVARRALDTFAALGQCRRQAPSASARPGALPRSGGPRQHHRHCRNGGRLGGSRRR